MTTARLIALAADSGATLEPYAEGVANVPGPAHVLLVQPDSQTARWPADLSATFNVQMAADPDWAQMFGPPQPPRMVMHLPVDADEALSLLAKWRHALAACGLGDRVRTNLGVDMQPGGPATLLTVDFGTVELELLERPETHARVLAHLVREFAREHIVNPVIKQLRAEPTGPAAWSRAGQRNELARLTAQRAASKEEAVMAALRTFGFLLGAILFLALAISVFLFTLLAIHAAHERDWAVVAVNAGLMTVYAVVGVVMAGEAA